MEQRRNQMRFRTNGRPLTTRRRIQRKKSLVDRILHKTEKNKFTILGVLTVGMLATVVNGAVRGSTNLEQNALNAGISPINTVSEEEKWRESLRYDVRSQNNTVKTQDIFESIIEQYNQNAETYGKQEMTENDILIYDQTGINDGQIYTDYSEDGTLEYHQNYKKPSDEVVEWVNAEELDGVYAIVNGIDKQAIAGIIKVNGEYEPLKVDLMVTGSNEEIYASEDYVTLDGEKEVYDSIKAEAQRRVEAQKDDMEIDM